MRFHSTPLQELHTELQNTFQEESLASAVIEDAKGWSEDELYALADAYLKLRKLATEATNS